MSDLETMDSAMLKQHIRVLEQQISTLTAELEQAKEYHKKYDSSTS